MNSNSPIVIRACENGFLLRAYEGDISVGRVSTVDEFFVFRTMAGLQGFVAEHFSHRVKEEGPDLTTPTEGEWIPAKRSEGGL